MAQDLKTLTEQSAPAENHTADGNALFAPEVTIVILTWVTFFALLAILSKYAWKPILAGLHQREEDIKKAVEESEKTHSEYLQIGEKRKKILMEADLQAKDILNQSRETALRNAKVLAERSKQEAQIIIENANREITAEQEKVAAYLREKSANTAVELASRILRENLDADKHKKIIDNLIDEIE